MTAPEIRLKVNHRVPTMSRESLTEAVHALREHIGHLNMELSQLRSSFNRAISDQHVEEISRRVVLDQREQLDGLIERAVPILEAIVTAGEEGRYPTRGELNGMARG